MNFDQIPEIFIMTNIQMQNISDQIVKFSKLRSEYQSTPSIQDKVNLLNKEKEGIEFLNSNPTLKKWVDQLQNEDKLVVKALLAIGQGPQVFYNVNDISDESKQNLLTILKDIEQFYSPIGGIIGYHLTFLELLQTQSNPINNIEDVKYFKPEGIHLDQDLPEVSKAVRWGIETLPQLSEIYVVGGSGDRLQLIEEATGRPQPVGHLPLLGETLFSLLIQDLQAREFLYYKLYGKQLETPIAMMTSHEKENNLQILELFEESNWFGRPKQSYSTFIQPLVPVITTDGHWAVTAPGELFLKPGGHGALWKLAHDKGIIDWLKNLSRSKALIRQINNPAAGIDNGLLALCGLGIHDDKAMGFASCDRRVNSPEGMDILIEKKNQEGFDYGITNIEYTDFATKGIKDVPEGDGKEFSIFPANTNILFLDLPSVMNALKKVPIPGILVNLKTTCTSLSKEGNLEDAQGGRLESTMQNIADGLLDQFSQKIKPGEFKKLKTFLTYNKRSKTIVTTKKAYVRGESFHDTPPGGYYELHQNHEELLRDYCDFTLPPLGYPEDTLKPQGLGFNFYYHAALGPLWKIIQQKIYGGVLSPRSELSLDIAEIEIKNLVLSGSLQIEAENILGSKDDHKQIKYNEHNGKCTLINVQIHNKGIKADPDNIYWKSQVKYVEAMKIHIHGSGEFYAEDVSFEGNIEITVPNGVKVTATNENGKLHLKEEKIAKPTWNWKYHFDENDQIVLKRIEHK